MAANDGAMQEDLERPHDLRADPPRWAPATRAPHPRSPDALPRGRVDQAFNRFAVRASEAAGDYRAFVVAALMIVVWAATGPIFHFSETWQLVINTGTTIITFLMVFLIQHTQNRDMRALQLKLDELIAANDGASNQLIDIESGTEQDMAALYEEFKVLAKKTAARVTR
jgi:low affinity Fe/Cu permease